MRGRDYVLPQDLRELAKDAFRHRIVLTYEALASDVDVDSILDRVRGGADAGDRARRKRGLSMTVAHKQRTPARPGPGPIPELLLRALDLTLGRRVDGVLAGDHRSSHLGVGTESALVREWFPGDDVRRIDWNVTARTNQVQVRVDVAERALTSWLLLDVSPSMAFGTADRRSGTSPRSRARVRLSGLAPREPRRRGHVRRRRSARLPAAAGPRRPHVLRAAHAEPETERVGMTSLGDAFTRVSRVARQRALVLVVSDFRGPRDWRSPLVRLTARHEVVVRRDPRPARAGVPRRRPPLARRSGDGAAAASWTPDDGSCASGSRPLPRRSGRHLRPSSGRSASVTSSCRLRATGCGRSRRSRPVEGGGGELRFAIVPLAAAADSSRGCALRARAAPAGALCRPLHQPRSARQRGRRVAWTAAAPSGRVRARRARRAAARSARPQMTVAVRGTRQPSCLPSTRRDR